MLGPRYWLVLAALPWAGAWAQPPGPPQAPASDPPSGRVQTSAPQSPPASAPDEEFIEFLGEDDYGDAAWEEFLKRAQPEAQKAPPPPQGAKQS